MVLATNLGWPRIGPNREYKKAIEAFWAQKISEGQLEDELNRIHLTCLRLQIEAGLDLVPVGDFSAYDLMLETSLMFGVAPRRFHELPGWKRYYAIARGGQEATACEMKKWFDTNYHYIVPEVEGDFRLKENRLLRLYEWAKGEFPKSNFKPVLIGPYTFLKLSRIKNNFSFEENLTRLTQVYQGLVRELAGARVPWLQIDEPALVQDVSGATLPLIKRCYEKIGEAKGATKIILQTYFGDVFDIYPFLGSLPVDALGLDLVRGAKNLEAIQKYGQPKEKWLGLGLVDGRNVWRVNLKKTLDQLENLPLNPDRILIHPSSSLLFVPISLEQEVGIPTPIKKRLSFAVEKLLEVKIIAKAFQEGKAAAQSEIKLSEAIWEDKEFAAVALNPKVQENIRGLKEEDFRRTNSFEERRLLQQKIFSLPKLPTTTIGSFPQTQELRALRARWKGGEISYPLYQEKIQAEISKVVSLQEEIGLDVLVHGESERTDMVEYFAEKLSGFQITKNGWVQSYGTRCVRPPIIYGDVQRKGPMTVSEIKFAQSKTKKWVKGMLTGPVTILNWSFPRSDISKSASAFQIALALRDEVTDLESEGITVIQIDEPALREGLPLKKPLWPDYLHWAVKAFRLSSSGVTDSTQIHSHMCYSEFADILDAIQDLDADVLSIEDSRSWGGLAKSLSEMHYKKGIGPGIYDVHSERIPSQEEFQERIQFLVNHIPIERLWINPDCGLKTRNFKEVIPSLKNMVAAVKAIRERL